MIIVRLTGGLGNQLFQFFAAYALGKKYGLSVGIDCRHFIRNVGRKYELDKFKISNYVSVVNTLPLSNPAHWDLLYQIIRRTKFVSIFENVFKEDRFEFNKSFFSLKIPEKGILYLDGLFQSYKYFEFIRNDVIDLMSPISALSDYSENVLDRIIGSNSVAIHVRRGDYVSNKGTAAYHGICSLDYYELAIRKILHEVDSPEFYIFSDDLLWAKANIVIPSAEVIYVDNKDPSLAHEDLVLMSKCKHNIIANSTFSWWPAWLNENQKKIVVVPRQWFQGYKVSTNDLIPDDWIPL